MQISSNWMRRLIEQNRYLILSDAEVRDGYRIMMGLRHSLLVYEELFLVTQCIFSNRHLILHISLPRLHCRIVVNHHPLI